MVNATWVAKRCVPILKENPNESARAIQKRLIAEYNVVLPYSTAWHGKERALKPLFGDWEKSFMLLFNFKREVQDRSPGSIVEVDTKEEGGNIHFKRFFMALSPCIEGFQHGCRPYLSVDVKEHGCPHVWFW